MVVDDLPESRQAVVCEEAWTWLMDERAPEYSQVFCLTQLARRADVTTVAACEAELQNCVALFPPTTVVQDTCGAVVSRGVCTNTLGDINACFSTWSTQIAQTAAVNDCTSLIRSGSDASLFPAPMECGRLVQEYRILVGF